TNPPSNGQSTTISPTVFQTTQVQHSSLQQQQKTIKDVDTGRDIVNFMNQILPTSKDSHSEYQASLRNQTIIGGDGARSFSMREQSDESSEDTAPKRRRNSSSGDDKMKNSSTEEQCNVSEFIPIIPIIVVEKSQLFRWQAPLECPEFRWIEEYRNILLDWLLKHPHCYNRDILVSDLLAEMGFTNARCITASHFKTKTGERILKTWFLQSIADFTHLANLNWSERLEHPGFVLWQQQIKGMGLQFQWVFRYNKFKNNN